MHKELTKKTVEKVVEKNKLKISITTFLAGVSLISILIGSLFLAVLCSLLGLIILLHNKKKHNKDRKVIEMAIHEIKMETVISLEDLRKPIEKRQITKKN